MQPGPNGSTMSRYTFPPRKEPKHSGLGSSYVYRIGIRVATGQFFSQRVRASDSYPRATKEQREAAIQLAEKNNSRGVTTIATNGMTLSTPLI